MLEIFMVLVESSLYLIDSKHVNVIHKEIKGDCGHKLDCTQFGATYSLSPALYLEMFTEVSNWLQTFYLPSRRRFMCRSGEKLYVGK